MVAGVVPESSALAVLGSEREFEWLTKAVAGVPLAVIASAVCTRNTRSQAMPRS